MAWIDVIDPTQAEEAQLERLLGVNVPSREDASEIQTSSRLIARNGTLYMSAIVAYGREMEPLRTLPVIFVRTGEWLITVRYGEPDAVDRFVERAGNREWKLSDADSILAALLEVIVDRIADRLEFIGSDLKKIERAIFRRGTSGPDRHRGPNVTRRIRVLQEVLERIGIHHMTSFGLRECLHSLERLLAFRRSHGRDHPPTTQFHLIEDDLRAIADYDHDLNNSMDFMVNATVGLIDVQQNKVIYILSIMSMVLTPPVVIASIYGMNFDLMPELHWRWGYAYALLLMLASAFVPWLLFKLKRWL
ncbi:CorA family divalent cation transporter [Geminicoccus roseus]|uniref:CorA family divalent cation transporter n=1 Tax=Geminicoccus roseus TaxID=404900 RepID=UPI000428D62D|nr:CorA family divalent cation transporter [Geminicoccus roseus]